MFEEILKEFLGTTKTLDDLFNEVFENKDKYKNGEHISHCEKEIKDGKVSEYVNNNINLDDKKNCKCGDNVCKYNKTDDVKDENNHSYFHSVKDKYKNGEHISHSEKEIKDGKVIKDVNNRINLEDKKNCKCGDNVCKCNKTDNVKDENNQLKVISQFWEDSFRSAENTLIERDKKIAELERKLAKVTKEKEYFINKLAKVTKDKEYLLNKFEQVKNVFSK